MYNEMGQLPSLLIGNMRVGLLPQRDKSESNQGSAYISTACKTFSKKIIFCIKRSYENGISDIVLTEQKKSGYKKSFHGITEVQLPHEH
jgi:hypothetical protein